MRLLVVVLALLWTLPAAAQDLRDCRDMTAGDVIIDPIELQGRSYANGEVTIAVIHDGRKPSADSMFVLVYAPDPFDPDQKQCRMISRDADRGYATVRLQNAQPKYTAANGLTVSIPARTFDDNTKTPKNVTLVVNVTRQVHEISAIEEQGLE